MTLGGDFNEGDATEAQLIKEKHRLEETVARLNIEIKNKNEKILELLESIEDLKINVYSRDKAVELLQGQISRLTEDLMEAKQFEHRFKALDMMKSSREDENAKLLERLGSKLESEVDLKSKDAEVEKRVMEAQINDLHDKLAKQKKQDE